MLFCEVMLWATFIALVICVFPYISADGWFPFLSTLFFSSQVFFALTVKKQPGFLSGKSKIPFIRLVEKFEPFDLCPACEVLLTADSYHCQICNQCVERFDHHCPWVNNCIGIKNHAYFYFYVVTQTAYLILTILMALLNINLLISTSTLERAKTTVVVFP